MTPVPASHTCRCAECLLEQVHTLRQIVARYVNADARSTDSKFLLTSGLYKEAVAVLEEIPPVEEA